MLNENQKARRQEAENLYKGDWSNLPNVTRARVEAYIYDYEVVNFSETLNIESILQELNSCKITEFSITCGFSSLIDRIDLILKAGYTFMNIQDVDNKKAMFFKKF